MRRSQNKTIIDMEKQFRIKIKSPFEVEIP